MIDYAFMARTFDRGVVLLTGTGVVPPSNLSLAIGDIVTIRISGLGTLSNTIKAVGREPAGGSAVSDAPN